MRAGARAAFRRRNLGFVFQFFNLVPMLLTAVQNVSLPLVLDGVAARSADARAEELLERVGLGDRARYRPACRTVWRTDATGGGGARSGGAAVPDPRRRADREPGQPFVDRDLDLLRSLSDQDGAAVVMVTHDQAAARYGSRQLHLVDGRACADETSAPAGER